jgi:hypothetical protein
VRDAVDKVEFGPSAEFGIRSPSRLNQTLLLAALLYLSMREHWWSSDFLRAWT